MKYELVVYDFDGVMTDNKVYVFSDGTEAVRCDRRDGYWVQRLREAGLCQVVLSQETNGVVRERCKKLGLEAHVGIEDKAQFVTHFCEAARVPLDRVVYVGDGHNDVEAMQLVGLSLCPADACTEARSTAHKRLLTDGGDGAIEEVAKILLFG